MPKDVNNGYTHDVLAKVKPYAHTTEYAIIRELCALYDHFCDCPSVIEQRLYVKRRIHNYIERLENERND